MSLYERVDRDVSSKHRETLEFFLVYAVCFVAMLVVATVRRLGSAMHGGRTKTARSIFGEARTMAGNCAATSFMGM